MLAAQAQAQHDVLKRQSEMEQENIMHMLKERGYLQKDHRFENEYEGWDDLELGELEPVRSNLTLSDGFVAHRATFANQNQSRSDYLRVGPTQLALQRSQSKAKSAEVVLAPREQARRQQEAVQQRLRLLISDVHVERAGRVWHASRAMDELGVFPRSVNELRARSECHAEALIRPSCSLVKLRKVAEQQLATGYERPPPTTSASGEPIALSAPDLLRGRLDRLEGRLHGGDSGGAPLGRLGSQSGSQRGGNGAPSSRRLPVSRSATQRSVSGGGATPGDEAVGPATPATLPASRTPAGDALRAGTPTVRAVIGGVRTAIGRGSTPNAAPAGFSGLPLAGAPGMARPAAVSASRSMPALPTTRKPQ